VNLRKSIWIAAVLLTLLVPAGLSSAKPVATQANAQPIYAAFSILKQGKLRQRRCGQYRVTTGTYTGRTTSPDPRLAGEATYVAELAINSGGSTGVARGTMTIRDSRGATRMRSKVRGVITNGGTVNGVVMGTLFGPPALLLANLTMVFDDRLGFAAVRLGLEGGANSAIAYGSYRC
jgi:hypothetical protein